MKKSVAIIGAGPIGLAAAAHVLESGLTPIVLEAGPDIGHAMREWAHVQLFSPWEYNIDHAASRLLTATGWNSPDPHGYPTGGELLERYLEPLAAKTALKEHIRTSSRVTDISRAGLDKLKSAGRNEAPFEIRYQNGQGPKIMQVDAVIDASGTWFSPNPAGANGLLAIGERDASARIAYGMPDVLGRDRPRYAGKIVAVLGAGHSAVGTLIELTELKRQAPDTRAVWLLRGDNPAKAFGGGANDKLSARGALGQQFAALVASGDIKVEAEFRVSDITLEIEGLRIGGGRSVFVDELIVATGFRPDHSFLRELRIQLDPAVESPVALAPLIDPNEHSCGTVRPHGAAELAQPEPGFFFAGMKSYGRAPTFLMMTGYEQVRSIAAALAGDEEGARRVDLVLPETGVCSRAPVAGNAGGCSSSLAASTADACCTSKAAAQQERKAGSGCGGAAKAWAQ